MFLQKLSDYINANAPMTNLPELFGLHHSNPLGLPPIAIPAFLLVLAVAMHVISHQIYYKQRRNLFPWLYALLDKTGYDGWIGCEYIPRADTLSGLGWFSPYRKKINTVF